MAARLGFLLVLLLGLEAYSIESRTRGLHRSSEAQDESLARSLESTTCARKLLLLLERSETLVHPENITLAFERILQTTSLRRGLLQDEYQKRFKEIQNEVLIRINEFTPQQLIRILRVHATLRKRDLAFFKRVARHLLDRQRLRMISPVRIGELCWAFAKLGIPHENLFAEISKEVRERMTKGFQEPRVYSKFRNRDRILIAWSFVILGHYDRELFQALRKQITSPPGAGHDSTQLFLVNVGLHVESDIPIRFPVNEDKLANDRNVSSLQTAVIEGLERIGFMCEPVDLVFFEFDCVNRENRTIVEIDGSHHYSENGEPLGPERFKDRLVKRWGWRVIRIPVWEWNQQRTEEREDRYLREKMAR